MKYRFLLLFIFCYIHNPLGLRAQCNQWQSVPSGTTQLLRAVHFADPQNGWVAGSGGVLLRSQDGGATWSSQSAALGADGRELYGVHFVNATTGWVVGAGGFVKRTTNGGSAWSPQTVNTTTDLYDVYFTDANTGWIAGACGLLLRTTNGGGQWQTVSTGQNYHITAVTAANGNNVSAATSGAVLLKSGDLGANWSPASGLTGDRNFRALAFSGATGWAANTGGKIWKSANGGATWLYWGNAAPFTGAWQSASATAGYVYIAGLGGKLVRSSGSASFFDFSDGIASEDLYGLYLLNDDRGWAVGAGGRIFRYVSSNVPPNCLAGIPLHQQTNVPTNTVINWPRAAGCPTGYRLSLGTTPGGSDLLSNQIVPDTFYQPAQPLPAGQPIYVRITPYNGAGEASGCGEFSFVTKTPCTITDSLALVALYTATDGPNWTNKWILTEPMNSWYGVTANPQGCVTKLDLFQNNLNGTIPAELGNLSELTELYLHRNNFYGGIPSSLQNLSQLTVFVLGHNPLGGPVPSWLDKLSNLVVLKLYTCQLSGSLPAEIGNLNKLEVLDINSNNLNDTIPDNYSNLVSLKTLCLSNNQLTGFLPDWLGTLSQLHEICLQQNLFSGSIPVSLGQLGLLEDLNLSDNHLSGTIPSGLGDLLLLRRIYLEKNDLSGCFPAQFQPFCSLGFSNNPLMDGFNFTNNPHLPWLGDFSQYCLGEQQIGAPCNDSLSNTSGDSINVNCTCAGDSINFCNPQSDSLVLVNLYNVTGGSGWVSHFNWLTPGQPISTWYGVHTNAAGCVDTLKLDGNNLINTLPAELGDLSGLQRLVLATNNLTGSIPPEWGRLNQLGELNLSQNAGLSGPIPDSLQRLGQLQGLYLNQTGLSGPIPGWLGGLDSLRVLNLSVMPNLGGTIPDTLGQLAALQKLYLNNSKLTGGLPVGMNNLKNLNLLNVSLNRLDQTLPDMSGMSALDSFFINQNRFTFEDFRPQMPFFNGLNRFLYPAQDSVFTDTTITGTTGQNLTIDLGFDAGMADNMYNWFKNGQPFSTITGNNKLTLNGLSLASAGDYYVQVTNPAAPQLTLFSRNIHLNVVPGSACGNSAGTFTVGPLIGQSNDISLDTVFLCFGDSLFIDHNGDAVFNGDPFPFTEPGVCWLFSKCRPTLGDFLDNLIADPCNFLSPSGLPIAAFGNDPEGDIWFYNKGQIQTFLNTTGPADLVFTPVTIDNFAGAAYEDNGPCLHLDTAHSFQVVYLTPLSVSDTIFQSCGGSFRVTGGIPAYDAAATYNIQISRVGNPAVTGLIVSPAAPKDGDMINFSIPAPGSYLVQVSDGKSCAQQFTFDIPALPSATANGDTLTCQQLTATLNAQTTIASPGFQWAGPSGFSSVQPSPATMIPGTYTVTVTGASGCSATAQTVVTPDNIPPGLSASADTLDCNHSVATLSGASGSPGATFAWTGPNGFQAAQGQVTTAQPGTYVLTVTNPVNFCTSSVTVEVVQQPDPMPSISIGGMLNCSITSTQLNATGGGTYLWSNNLGTNATATVSAPGTYTVTVTDSSTGCTASATATVLSDTAQPSCSAVGGQINCNNPTVKLSGATSTPGATWTWTGPNGFTATALEPVVGTPGDYTFTVTAPNGCMATASAGVTGAPDLPLVTASGGSIDCAATTATLMASSSIPGSTYAWAGPNGFSSSQQNPLVSLAGVYTVTVTAAPGCTATATASVTTDTNPPNVTATGGTLGCQPASVTLKGNSSTPGILFSWTGPNGFSSTLQNPVVTVPGQYTLTVANPANHCTNMQTAQVSPPVLPTPAISGTLNICAGSSTTLTATAGFPAYNWTSGAQTPEIIVTTAGTYTVQVTDALGCTGTVSATVGQNPLIVLTPTPTPASCGQTNGVITLSVSGGTPGYSYKWSNGATTQNLSNLAAGLYTITVTDNAQCTATATAEVTNPNAPSANATPADAGCNQTNGRIDLVVQGGSPNYTFKWSNGATTQNLTGLPAGQYTVTVTDSANCSTTTSTTVNAPLPPVISASTTPAGCGQSDGIVDLIVSGGTSPYTFLWSTGASTGDLPNVPAGTYSVTVTDAATCTATLSATVSNPDAPKLSTAVTPSGCNQSTGAIDLSVQGGTPGYTYSWSNGATAQDISGLSGGVYTVTVTDLASCSAVGSVEVPGGSDLTITPATQAAGCGFSNGSINLGVQGGTAPYTYLWNTGATAKDLNNLSAGAYTVTVTDAASCTGMAAATVTPKPGLITPDTIRATLCPGGSIQFGNVTISQAGVFSAKFPGINGCDTLLTLRVDIDLTELLVAKVDTFQLPPDATAYEFRVTANDLRVVDWRLEIETPPLHGTADTLDREVIRYTRNDPAAFGYDSLLYRICATEDCPDLCDSAWMFVFLPGATLESAKDSIPNAFIPESEVPENQVFDPVGILINLKVMEDDNRARLYIFNRWGEVVFRNRDHYEPWNGKQNERLLPQGTYYYQLTLDLGEKEVLKGPVQLLRR